MGRLITTSLAFASTSNEMPIQYLAFSETTVGDTEETQTKIRNGIELIIADVTTGQEIYRIELPQGETKNTLMTANIAPAIQAMVSQELILVNRLYRFGVRITDSLGNLSSAQQMTLTVATLSLTPDSTELDDKSTDTEYRIRPIYTSTIVTSPYIHYKVIDQQNADHIYQEGDINELTSNTASKFTVTYQAGRVVRIYTQLFGYVQGKLVSSNVCEQSLMFIDPNNLVPRINILSWPEVRQYNAYAHDAVVRYRISYAGLADTLSGSLIINEINGSTEKLYYQNDQDFRIGTTLEWSVPFEKEGQFQLKITVGAGASMQVAKSSVYTVKGSSGNVPVVTAGAQFDFTPDKTESSANKDQWSAMWMSPEATMNADGTYSLVGEIPIVAEFENFNWTTNGWRLIPGTNRSKLVLNNGAKLTLPVMPFYGQYQNVNHTFDGAVSTGKTIEFDIKISNVRDRTKRIIECASYNTRIAGWQEKEPVVGIIATGDYFTLTGSGMDILTSMQTKGVVADKDNGLVAHYGADSRVHICYVIASKTTNIDGHFPKNYIYTFVNGILSGVVERPGNMEFKAGVGENYLNATIFDSTYADIEIYNYRFYGNTLTPEAVLNNYLANVGNIDDAIARKQENDVLENYIDEANPQNNYAYVSLAKVKALGTIPYMVLRGGLRCNKKGKPTGNNEVSLPYFTKNDYRYMDGYFVDPKDFSKCKGIKDPIYEGSGDARRIVGFTSNFADRWQLVVYCQGTSSLEYPVKNLRIQSVNKKEKYTLFDDNPPSKRFTIKADYMDSSMSHNTGTANQLNDLYAGLGIEPEPTTLLKNTNSEYKNYTMLTAIRGRPMVIFFRGVGLLPDGTIKNSNDGTGNPVSVDDDDRDILYEYIGRYNFNFDKGEPDLFGFFEDPDANNYGITKDEHGVPLAGYEAISEDIFDTLFATNTYTDPETEKEVTVNYYIGPRPFHTDMGDLSKTWMPPTIDVIDPDPMMIENPVKLTDAQLESLQGEIKNRLVEGPLYIYRSGETTFFRLGPDGPDNKETTVSLQGYRSSIQCWEMKNNNNDLTSFRVPYDYQYDEVAANHDVFDPKTNEQTHVGKPYEIWTAAYESRYPAQLEEGAADKRAFTAFINWLASTNQFTTLSEEDYQALVVNHGWETWLEEQQTKQETTANKRAALEALPETSDTNTTYLPYPIYDATTGARLEGDEYEAAKAALIAEAEDAGETVPVEHSAQYRTYYDEYIEAYTASSEVDNRIACYRQPYLNSQNPITVNGVEYDHDTQEKRLEKFSAECEKHLDKARTCFYYILTELEVLMDSRAKNMMVVSYDANNETGEGHWYPIFYDMDTQLGVNNTGKLVYRYDVKDTTFGVYNTTADYPRDDNGKIDFTRTNMEYSVLWTNFRLAFSAGGYHSYIGEQYRTLRSSSLTYNNLMAGYNEDLANAWCESFINQDTYYKYIRPKDQPNWLYNESGYHVPSDPTEKKNSANWSTAQWEAFSAPGNEDRWALRDTSYASLLYAAQGTRTEHRKQWLKRRMLLLDGKYAADTAAFKFTFRTNVLHGEDPITHNPTDDPVHLSFTADDSSYIWLNFEKNYLTEGHVKGPLYIPEHGTLDIDIPMDHMSSQENESLMMFVSNILDFGTLGRVGMANVGVTDSTGMNVTFKVRNLNFGLTAKLQQERETKITNPWTNFDGKYFPMLESLNLDYMYSPLTAVTLHDSLSNKWSNSYLREFSAKQSYVDSIEFPQGGVLERIYVPDRLTYLKLINQPLLRTVVCDNNSWRMLSKIYISNCNNFDSKAIVKVCVKKDSTDGTPNRPIADLENITLLNINWTLDPTDPEECEVQDNRIVALPLLDKLITLPSYDGLPAPWSVDNNKQVNIGYYISGTVHINNGETYGLDAVSLQEKYCGCYPNLVLTYDDNEYVTSSFTVSYYNANKEIISKYTKQYAMDRVPNLTATDLFNAQFNLRDFSKSPEASHIYELVGFKFDSNAATDLFTESIAGAANPVTYESAFASARAVSDVYVTANWTTATSSTRYDPNTNYYTMKSLHVIGDLTYMWAPTDPEADIDDIQDEFVDYLQTHTLYIYNGASYEFAPGFNMVADNQHRETAFYPVYVAKIREYPVRFYDKEEWDPETKVAEMQFVRYNEPAEDPSVSVSKMELIEDSTFSVKVYKNVSYPSYARVTQELNLYPTFSNPVNIQQNPTGGDWFNLSDVSIEEPGQHTLIVGKVAEIKADYPYAAICVPKMIDGHEIVGLNNAKKRTTQMIEADIAANDAQYEALSAEDKITAKSEYRATKKQLQLELASTQNLKRIFFEDNNAIKFIEHGAFTGQPDLEFVDFTACTNLLMIGRLTNAEGTVAVSNASGTFRDCPKLQVKQLPHTIVTFGVGCFYNDPLFQLEVFPANTVLIGAHAFYNDTGLRSVTVGGSGSAQWTHVYRYAFAGCVNLEFPTQNNLEFQNLLEIQNNAFEGCSKVKFFLNPNIQNSALKIIGMSAFQGCSKLGWQYMPTTIQSIGAYAFAGAGSEPNNNLMFSTFQSDLENIGANAFDGVDFTKADSGGIVTFNIDRLSKFKIAATAFANTTVQSFRFQIYNRIETEPTVTEESFSDWLLQKGYPWGANNGNTLTPYTTQII